MVHGTNYNICPASTRPLLIGRNNLSDNRVKHTYSTTLTYDQFIILFSVVSALVLPRCAITEATINHGVAKEPPSIVLKRLLASYRGEDYDLLPRSNREII